MVGVDAEVLQQGAFCICRQAGDVISIGAAREGKIVVVIVPDQNLDLSIFPRGDYVDIRLCPHSGAHNFRSCQGS